MYVSIPMIRNPNDIIVILIQAPIFNGLRVPGIVDMFKLGGL